MLYKDVLCPAASVSAISKSWDYYTKEQDLAKKVIQHDSSIDSPSQNEDSNVISSEEICYKIVPIESDWKCMWK